MKATDHPAPFNVEAERAVLGSMLLDRGAIAIASAILTRDDFFRDSHRDVFAALLALFHRAADVDFLTLADELESAGRLADIGGYAALSDLMNAVPTALHVEQYAKIVAADGARRRMIGAAEGIVGALHRNPTQDVSEMVAGAVDAILKAAPNTPPTTHRLRDGRAIEALLENLDRAEAGEEIGLPLALSDLQALVGGLRDGRTTLLAGRPGMGKSSLAVWEILHALRKGKRVLMYSLEMPVEEVYARLASALDRATPYRTILGTGRITGESADAARRALDRLYSSLKGELWVDDAAGLTAAEIRARVLMHIARHGRPDLVVVDHIHEIALPGQNAHKELGEAIKLLRRVAKDERYPQLLLAQLSRDLERRNNKRPMLADLRESGTLEEAADVVMFLYRDDYYNPDSATPGVTEVNVAKNRQGETGAVEVRYEKPTGVWGGLARFADPGPPSYSTNGHAPAHDIAQEVPW